MTKFFALYKNVVDVLLKDSYALKFCERKLKESPVYYVKLLTELVQDQKVSTIINLFTPNISLKNLTEP